MEILGIYGDYKVLQLNVTTILTHERKPTNVCTMPNYEKLSASCFMGLFVCMGCYLVPRFVFVVKLFSHAKFVQICFCTKNLQMIELVL